MIAAIGRRILFEVVFDAIGLGGLFGDDDDSDNPAEAPTTEAGTDPEPAPASADSLPSITAPSFYAP